MIEGVFRGFWRAILTKNLRALLISSLPCTPRVFQTCSLFSSLLLLPLYIGLVMLVYLHIVVLLIMTVTTPVAMFSLAIYMVRSLVSDAWAFRTHLFDKIVNML